MAAQCSSSLAPSFDAQLPDTLLPPVGEDGAHCETERSRHQPIEPNRSWPKIGQYAASQHDRGPQEIQRWRVSQFRTLDGLAHELEVAFRVSN
jgi:hypothetical protein